MAGKRKTKRRARRRPDSSSPSLRPEMTYANPVQVERVRVVPNKELGEINERLADLDEKYTALDGRRRRDEIDFVILIDTLIGLAQDAPAADKAVALTKLRRLSDKRQRQS